MAIFDKATFTFTNLVNISIGRFILEDEIVIDGGVPCQNGCTINKEEISGEISDLIVDGEQISVGVHATGQTGFKWNLTIKLDGNDLTSSPIEKEINDGGNGDLNQLYDLPGS